MQTTLAALIVVAAVGVLIHKLRRMGRAGPSCSCGDDCRNCSGCPAQQSFNGSDSAANK